MVTIRRPENVYEYIPRNLLLAYFLSAAFDACRKYYWDAIYAEELQVLF